MAKRELWEFDFTLFEQYATEVPISWAAIIFLSFDPETKALKKTGAAGISSGPLNTQYFRGADLELADQFIKASRKKPDLLYRFAANTPTWIKNKVLNYLRENAD